MEHVVMRLKKIISKTNGLKDSQMEFLLRYPNSRELNIIMPSNFDQAFENVSTNEIIECLRTLSKEQEILNDNYILIKGVILLILKRLNEGKELNAIRQSVLDYINDSYIDSQEILYWLSSNQNDSDCVFSLGYFHYNGIIMNE